jgi:hypothetical protein
MLIAALLIAASIVASSSPSSAPALYRGGAPGAATVSGRIALNQAVPPHKFAVTKDGDKCGREKSDEAYVYSTDLGLKNVVVWLEGVSQGKNLPHPNVSLENVTCVYVPHVLAATVGSTLEIRNLDGVQHNTHGYLVSETFGFLGGGLPQLEALPSMFNVSLPVKGLVVKRKLDRAGIVDVRNDAGHPWMRAWIAVFDQPYFAVSDEHGEYSIDEVPQGNYVLHAWHETAGEHSTPVNVPAIGSVTGNFQF